MRLQCIGGSLLCSGYGFLLTDPTEMAYLAALTASLLVCGAIFSTPNVGRVTTTDKGTDLIFRFVSDCIQFH